MLSFIVMGVKGAVIIGFFCWLFAKLLRPEEAKWIRGAPTFLAIGIYVLGTVTFNIWIYYAIMLFAIPYKAISRADAVALYPIALISMPEMLAYVLVGGAMITGVDKWVVFAIGMIITMYMHPKRPPETKGYLDIAFLMLFMLEFLQARGQNFTSIIRTLTVPVVLAVPYYVVSRNLKTVEDIRKVFLSFTFIGFILSGVAAIEMKFRWLIYQSHYLTLNMPLGGVSAYSKSRSGMLRAPASFNESTSFGLFLAFTMMFMLASRDIFKKKRNWMLAMGMNVLGILATNSRNTLVALAIGLPLYDLYRKRYASLAAKAGVLGIAYMTILLLGEFIPFFAGLAGNSADTSDTGDYRKMLFQRGMEEIGQHPLTGEAMGDAMRALADLRQGEGIVDLVNGYIGYGLNGGYPAIAMTLLLFIIPMIMLYVRRKTMRFDVRLQRYAGAVFAIAAFSIVTTFFTGFGNKPATFYVITIAIGTAIMNVKAPRKVPPPAEPEPEPTAELQLQPA